MLNSVRLIDDPVLRKPCEAVDVADLAFIVGFLDAMYQTMTASGGIGLAANQIGCSERIFILRAGDTYQEYINPEVLSQEELVDFEGEGCLSIPGVTATTKRFRKLKLRWQDKQGEDHEGSFEDTLAFAVQHEMDHLDGKLYIDKLGPVKRSLVLAKHKKHIREQLRRI